MKNAKAFQTLVLALTAAALTGCGPKQPEMGQVEAADRPSATVSGETSAVSRSISSALPVRTIVSLRAGRADGGSNLPVRIKGTVLDKRPGEFIVVNDGTGTMLAETRQQEMPALQQAVEVTGQLVFGGSVAGLKNCVITWPGSEGARAGKTEFPPVRPADLPLLTNVWQVRDLPAEKAAWHYPVRLRAIVTVNSKANHFFFVQDSSGGFSVKAPEIPAQLDPGMVVDIQGVSDPGGYSPIVLSSNVTVLGTAPLPPARPVTLYELAAGQDGSQWIEVRGVVQSITFSNGMARLALGDWTSLMTVKLPASREPAHLLDAVVRIRGACGSKSNERRQFAGFEMWA